MYTMNELKLYPISQTHTQDIISRNWYITEIVTVLHKLFVNDVCEKIEIKSYSKKKQQYGIVLFTDIRINTIIQYCTIIR